MENEDGYFDAAIAARYDDMEMSEPRHVDPAVDRLEQLAGGGRVLEFAIGTGRIALPLARRGIAVEGIELSRAMVAKLREKETGDPIPIVTGDMSTARVPGAFSLVYLVFNTISNLTSQEAQVACFRNAARHLQPGGRFLIEVGVPPLQKLKRGERFLAFDHSEDHIGIDEFDVATQRSWSHHVWFDKDGAATRFTVPFRYAFPQEFDLMAQLAGMSLEARWSGWKDEPFTADSERHVSVWRKDDT